MKLDFQNASLLLGGMGTAGIDCCIKDNFLNFDLQWTQNNFLSFNIFQVPRVFINGKFVGGGSEVKALQSSGKLKPMLQEVGAL